MTHNNNPYIKATDILLKAQFCLEHSNKNELDVAKQISMLICDLLIQENENQFLFDYDRADFLRSVKSIIFANTQNEAQ